MKLVVHQDARAELGKSRRWYEKRQDGLGFQLLDDVRAALSKIEHDPKIGNRYLNTPYRFYRTKQFPYVIYYLELADHVCVMAIAHERRRPGYWRRRKPE
jgi:toxin ParE1/3/4